MKRLIVLIALLAIASSAPATTLGNWGSGGAGLWSDGTKWAAGSVPGLGTSTGDEIKVQAANADVTIDSTAALDYNVRLTAGGATGVVIRIVSGATFGMGEWRNGAQGNATTGGNCTTYQTGGTLNVSDLIMGRGGSSSTLGVAETTTYTISGGTIQTRSGGNGRLYVGGANNTGAGASLHNATFTVDGAASIISLRKLYVGASDATHGATGNLEFKVVNGAVSKISLSDASAIILDNAGANGVANLMLSATGAMGAGNIVLVEQTSTGAVSGIFDQLNGVVGAATQGAAVALGGNNYYLSYVYDASTGIDGNGNDIALVVPEPATMVVLGLGGLLLRRRLA
jgi:hypothetical protein